MSSELGYDAALRQYLQPALQDLVRERVIDDNIAHQLARGVEQWGWGFTSSLPVNTTVDENVFINELKKFMVAVATEQGLLRQPSGYGREPMRMGAFQQPMQQYNQGYGGFQRNTTVEPSRSPVFGAHGASDPNGPIGAVGTHGAVTAAVVAQERPNVAVVENAIIPEYVPEWVRTPDKVVTGTQLLGPMGCSEYIYPSSEHEHELTFYKLLSDSAAPIGDVQGIALTLRRYFTTSSDLLVSLDTTMCQALRGIKRETLEGALKDIGTVADAKSSTPSERLDSIMQILQSNHPHGIFVAFEKLVVDEFNLVLHSRRLYSSDQSGIEIMVSSYEHMQAMHPAQKDPRFLAFTTHSGYARAYTATVSEILDRMLAITIGTDHASARYAALSLPGDEGAKWDFTLEQGLVENDNACFDSFYTKYSVIRYPATLMFSDIDLTKLPASAAVLSGASKAAVLTKKSGNFEHLLPQVHNDTVPFTLIDINTGKPILVGAHNLDDKMVVVKA